jgi:hypothetical protein
MKWLFVPVKILNKALDNSKMIRINNFWRKPLKYTSIYQSVHAFVMEFVETEAQHAGYD